MKRKGAHVENPDLLQATATVQAVTRVLQKNHRLRTESSGTASYEDIAAALLEARKHQRAGMQHMENDSTLPDRAERLALQKALRQLVSAAAKLGEIL